MGQTRVQTQKSPGGAQCAIPTGTAPSLAAGSTPWGLDGDPVPVPRSQLAAFPCPALPLCTFPALNLSPCQAELQPCTSAPSLGSLWPQIPQVQHPQGHVGSCTSLGSRNSQSQPCSSHPSQTPIPGPEHTCRTPQEVGQVLTPSIPNPGSNSAPSPVSSAARPADNPRAQLPPCLHCSTLQWLSRDYSNEGNPSQAALPVRSSPGLEGGGRNKAGQGISDQGISDQGMSDQGMSHQGIF